MTFGSLFAGIGGLDLGLERAGMTCKWQVEIDEFCQKILTKHWPNVPKYRDVRECGDNLERVDLICGGFPCQDVSVAGKRAGITGSRSGLWTEFARIIRLLRPRFVLVENVPGLLSAGFGRVLGDLAESGYDAEWDCIPAAAVGAPHLRYRVFIVAYPVHGRYLHKNRKIASLSDSHGPQNRLSGKNGFDVPNPHESGLSESICPGFRSVFTPDGKSAWGQFGGATTEGRNHWSVECDVGRVANGVPARVDRLRALGNAVVPQVAEWIGRKIVEFEAKP